MYVTSLLVCVLLAQVPPPPAPPREIGKPAGPKRAAPANTFPAERDAAPPPISGGIAPARSTIAPPDAQPPAAPQQPPAAPQQPQQPLVPVEPRSERTAPLEILSVALAVPEGEKPRGRPMPLVEVLRSVPDRAGQLRHRKLLAVAEALADYNFAWDEYQQFERLKPAQAPDAPASADQPILATRLQAAKARLQDADVTLVAAEYDLAARFACPPARPCRCRPTFRTSVHIARSWTMFTRATTIPPRPVLIDRTLPVRAPSSRVPRPSTPRPTRWWRPKNRISKDAAIWPRAVTGR